MENRLFMMIGLPGAGKTFIAHQIAEIENAEVISSDEIRKELGDINDQSNNTKVFEIVEKRIIDGLKAGKNMIYDATNINYKRRMAFLDKIKHLRLRTVAMMVATPYEECLERNTSRERSIPEEVIRKMYLSFDVPQYYEGFYSIRIVHNEIFPLKWRKILKSMNIKQDNPHHTLTLKKHCQKVDKILRKEGCQWYMKDIGLLHDVGKVQTKTFVNTKGELTDIAHYYHHENVGAYISCLRIDGLWELDEIDTIMRAGLIRWHMLLHQKMSEQTKNKYRSLFGESVWRNLEQLYKADCEAK